MDEPPIQRGRHAPAAPYRPDRTWPRRYRPRRHAVRPCRGGAYTDDGSGRAFAGASGGSAAKYGLSPRLGKLTEGQCNRYEVNVLSWSALTLAIGVGLLWLARRLRSDAGAPK